MGQDHVIAIIGCIVAAVLLIGFTIGIVNKSDDQTDDMMEAATVKGITDDINELAK